MTIQDDQFTNSKEHQVAMAARGLMSGLSDLCDLAETREGALLARNELGDLALAHVRFSRLLRDLYVKKVV